MEGDIIHVRVIIVLQYIYFLFFGYIHYSNPYVMWDRQHFVKYFSHLNDEIFHKILSIPHNTIMDLNNVMQVGQWYND